MTFGTRVTSSPSAPHMHVRQSTTTRAKTRFPDTGCHFDDPNNKRGTSIPVNAKFSLFGDNQPRFADAERISMLASISFNSSSRHDTINNHPHDNLAPQHIKGLCALVAGTPPKSPPISRKSKQTIGFVASDPSLLRST